MKIANKIQLLAQPSLYNAFRKLMYNAFPENERRPEQGFLKQMASENFGVKVFLDEKLGLSSFITYWDLDDFLFVEHLAVVEGQRGQGRFSAMLGQLDEFYGKSVVFEVEPPTSQQAIDRIAIYRHKGFFVYDFPYQQPPYRVDNHPIDMILMGNRPHPSVLDLEDWVWRIHHIVYSLDFL